MSEALTVIGSQDGSTSLTIPVDQTGPIVDVLQAELDTLAGAVTTGAASFYNSNPSIFGTTGPAGSGTGIYEFSDIANQSGGPILPDPVDYMPAGYSTLLVQAPGAETIFGTAADNFLAVFGARSRVTFQDYDPGGGNPSAAGSIVAGGNNFVDVYGYQTLGLVGGFPGPISTRNWSILGGASGSDTIDTTAENTSITTQGANNVVGLAGVDSTVLAAGSDGIVAVFGPLSSFGSNLISVTGAGNSVEISGGNDTVGPAAGSSSLNVFFYNTGGGVLDFVNQSDAPASVTGGADGLAGAVTAFGGAGGGYYEGGTFGNNSLVGGVGAAAATLIGAGVNNFLSVDGSGANALFAGDGNATLVAGTGTEDNLFAGGTGTDHIISFGSGIQSFFTGHMDGETLTGSTVTGASNNYYLQEGSTDGGATDVIINFTLGKDHLYVNPFAADSAYGAVTVQDIQPIESSGIASSLLTLSDSTLIKLVGVQLTAAQQASIVGSANF